MSSRSKLLATCGGALTDPNFRNVTLLLHGNGSNGAQNNTFLDSSSNNFTITRNGNTTQGSFSPYGSVWSNYMYDGSLSASLGASGQFGSGDFTVECFINPIAGSNGSGDVIWTFGLYPANNGMFLSYSSNGNLNVYIGGATAISATSALTMSAWQHVAVTRSGTTLRLFVNGSQVGSATNSTNLTDGFQYIGRPNDVAAYFFRGYISNFRAVKGTSLYNSAFTPPTTPLTAISGTSLLTCQSNRFRDASANNFAITRNGDVKVSSFGPFAPSAAYSTATNGGSMYFDGSGDFLQYTGSSANDLGSGNFTIEFWVNAPSLSDKFFINLRGGMSGSPHLTTGGYGGTTIGSLRWVSDSGTITSGSTVVTDNAWHHCAVVRNGTTVTLYVDGANRGSGTDTVNYSGDGGPITVGSNGTGGGNPFQGYLSNLRIVKGTAVYTANFTPPTAPVTAISGTSLLLNATNAAIFDNSAKNDLETVGNAQISTSVKKFGTGSMYFDGNGDYLVAPTSGVFGFGTGSFTLECFIYIAGAMGTGGVILDFRSGAGTAVKPVVAVSSSGNLEYFVNGSVVINGGSVATGTWLHIAVCKSGSSTRMFVNGTQVGSTYSDTNDYGASARCYVGADDDGSPNAFFNGYIDDLRVTKGVARYTANFTPPTAAFPDQ